MTVSAISISAPYTTDHLNSQIDRFTINEIGQAVYVNDSISRQDRIPPNKINHYYYDTQPDISSVSDSPLSSTVAFFSCHPITAEEPIKEHLLADKQIVTEAEPLIDVYFDYVHKYIPMIHKSSLIKQMHNTTTPPSRLLLYAMCAVASRWSLSQLGYSGSNLIPPGYTYYQKALGLLDDFFDVPRVSTIQALILLVKYQEYFQRIGYFHRSYAYLGIAARMCIDLGLSEVDGEGVEAEVSKRTFWATFTYDIFVSIEQGRDTYFEASKCVAGYPVATTEENSVYEDAITNHNILIQLSKILSVTYSIKRRFTIRKQTQGNQRTKEQTVEEQSWLFSIHTHLENFFYEISQDSFAESQTTQDPYIGLIYMTYYFCIILLHRSYIENPLDETEYNFAPYPHRRLCVNAASNITSIAESLQKRFPIHVFALPIRGVQHTIHCLAAAATIHQHEMLHTEDAMATKMANGWYLSTVKMVQSLSMQSPSIETVKYFNEQHRKRPSSAYFHGTANTPINSEKPRPLSMAFLENQMGWSAASSPVYPVQQQTSYPQQQPQSMILSDLTDLQKQELTLNGLNESPCYEQYDPIPDMNDLFLIDKDEIQNLPMEM
jgi:hypothetical protein